MEKTVGKTRDKILRIIMENSEITALELSDKLEITSRAIEKSINQLKNEGILIRKGSKKTGYWEIKSSE
ncbi:MAG: HTH domain-containing protein [Bacteroidetes bacterium]|nr:HTH domain-containing protein [Bacteroidota bacterium]